MKKALKRCGHPEWILEIKQNKEKNKTEVEPYARITIPYMKKLSEKLAKTFRKYNIEVIHTSTTTIKNIVCNKMKDKVHDLDKTGTIYHIKCNKHSKEYIGETERVLRSRLYEHKIITHKEANTSHSLTTKDNEIRQDLVSNRKSCRNKNTINYKDMHEGKNQILNEGNTEVSNHMASDIHNKGDTIYEIIGREGNWYKRGIKEAIAIKEINPNMNVDEGRYNIPAIYDLVLKKKKSNVQEKKRCNARGNQHNVGSNNGRLHHSNSTEENG